MPANARSSLQLLLSLAALSSLGLSAAAQTAAPSYMQSQPAPIERSQPSGQFAPSAPQDDAAPAARPPQLHRPAIQTSQPAPGIYVRVTPQGSVTTVSATPGHTELRVDSGIANISIHHPDRDSLILVDLAGGQVALVKDGLYTFNAATKTARVLVGEAEAYPTISADPTGKGIKVKEDHAITFGGAELRAVEFDPYQARTDLLPRDSAAAYGDGRPAYPAYGYPYYYYGYPYYPYYAWGYPYYGWGYPYGFGLGFGYYGGFYGGYGHGFYGRR
jgi:hypothetical protein